MHQEGAQGGLPRRPADLKGNYVNAGPDLEGGTMSMPA